MLTVCVIVAGRDAVMNNGIKKSTFRIAVCAIIAALGVVLMMITSIVPVGTYALPCFAGILMIAVIIEYGVKWSIGVFAVISVLSVFLAGDKEAVLYFIAFFGYYPIIKSVFESKIKNKFLLFFLKLAVFNAAAVASFFIGTFLLSIPNEDYTLFGVYIPWAFLAIGNIFFVFYDYAVTIFVAAYLRKLRGKLFGKLK